MGLRIADNVVSEVLDGQAVILNLRTGQYFGLNATGTVIWQLIEEHGDPERIRAELLGRFDTESDVVDADLRRLIAVLQTKGLVSAT
ncbi:MAG TPA: PqqD family protein [Polyangiaceae bacterium]|jgi:hypothetical protein